MGHGRIKAKNNLKKEYMEPLRKYAEQLEKENASLKGDPNTVVGQFIGQFKELYSQNSRLSVLCACLIEKLSGKIILTKAEMEAFQQKRVNIKWEVPDGIDPKDATEYVFSYELEDVPAPQPQAPAEPVLCTDPSCSLPKEDRKSTRLN